MNETATVKIGEDQIEIETKPVTIVAPSQEMANQRMEMVDEDIVTITPELTLKAAASVSQAEWAELIGVPQFVDMLKLVTKSDPPEMLASAGLGFKHLVGLVLLTIEAINDEKRPHWAYPETYLHPAWQVGLADLVVFITSEGKNERESEAPNS